jgi:hypothetical protein
MPDSANPGVESGVILGFAAFRLPGLCGITSILRLWLEDWRGIG